MICNFYASTIGKKIVVAVTGLILFGFVVAHLLGNLQIFLGPDKINEYAELLEKNEHILWVARAVLLAAVFLHAFATVQLSRLNRRSRPISYEHHETIQASLPSRVMIWGGLFLAFYIVFHLTHLTWGQTHPSFIEGDVYHNLISGFSVWYVSVFYLFGMAALGMHLYHGLWSVFQTLGLTHPAYNSIRKKIAVGASIGIAAGYSAIPLAVLLGILR